MSAAMDRSKFFKTNSLNQSILKWIVLAQYQSLEWAYISTSGMNGLIWVYVFYFEVELERN